MKLFTALTSLAFLCAITAETCAADFSYNYLELKGDYSRTENISEGASENADGNSFALISSHEISDSWYAKAGFSKENKSFGNSDPVGTPISLSTEQIFLELGLGYRLSINDQTDLYAEALALDTEVQHDLPVVTVDDRGPPRFTLDEEGQAVKRLGILDGLGYGLGVGARRWLGRQLDLETSLRGVHIARETEVTIALSGRIPVAQGVALGALASHGWSTDDNFNNITKAAVSLRFHF